MKKIKAKIKGTSPLLMNFYNVDAELERQAGRRTTKTYDSKIEANKSAYWSTSGKKQLIIPSVVLYAAILNASSFYKLGKRSAKAILAGSIRVNPMEIPLGTDKYAVDVRPVVINRAKVLKGRARLDLWEAEFEIEYDENLISDITVLESILIDAGRRIGIMDFRPQKGGPYGCFEVIKFKAE